MAAGGEAYRDVLVAAEPDGQPRTPVSPEIECHAEGGEGEGRLVGSPRAPWRLGPKGEPGGTVPEKAYFLDRDWPAPVGPHLRVGRTSGTYRACFTTVGS